MLSLISEQIIVIYTKDLLGHSSSFFGKLVQNGLPRFISSEYVLFYGKLHKSFNMIISQFSENIQFRKCFLRRKMI